MSKSKNPQSVKVETMAIKTDKPKEFIRKLEKLCSFYAIDKKSWGFRFEVIQ